LIVLFVGAEADSHRLSSLLRTYGEPIRLTRVGSWRAFSSVSRGWDAVVAGGPAEPINPAELHQYLPVDFTTPILAVANSGITASDAGATVEWFEPHEFHRTVPLLRAIRRAVLAEDRRRYLEECVEALDLQARQTGRLRVLGQMAAGVAHEFNNVLTVISGYCERLLPRIDGSDELQRLVRPIQQAGSRGVELSQRLLAFSRTNDQAVGHASLTAVLQEAEGMLRPLLGETVSLRTHLDHTLPRVRGDAGSLIEVVANLSVNARDAMPAGGVLSIETTAIPGEETDGLGRVKLVVRDTGTGMSEETLARACDPFFTTKAQGSGTGLGLSLVREIVDRCGGTLDIKSELGAGTEVTITLAAVCPDDVYPTVPIAPETSAPGGGETILLVEDDEAVREIVLEFLRSAAYRVIEARDADDALALVSRETRPVDLLVSDIVLPGQNGPALAATIRQFAPQMRTLFISGYPSDSAGETRSSSFLAKPFSRAALLQAVRRALITPRLRDIDAPEPAGRLGECEPERAAEQEIDGPH
jgi:signal transduction histidine kinase/ActR/RegA family two-component response regulator